MAGEAEYWGQDREAECREEDCVAGRVIMHLQWIRNGRLLSLGSHTEGSGASNKVLKVCPRKFSARDLCVICQGDGEVVGSPPLK